MADPRMPDICDYAVIRNAFSRILRPSRGCVISGDLDGVFSAVLLSHVLQWEVVGIYTLKNLWIGRQWLPKQVDEPESAVRQADLVFLDHDIYRSNVDSIGHHLLQWSPETPIPLHTDVPRSLNPNLLRGITKKEFGRKYPFGTFHFLLACASAWGLIPDFEPDDQITSLLLHIDSSFVNAINYQDNAFDWLNWLGGSEKRSPLYPVCRRMLRFTPRMILEQSRVLAKRFKDMGIRPRSQAPLTDATDEEQMARLRALVAWFSSETGWHGRFPVIDNADLTHFAMDRRSGNPTKSLFTRVIQAEPFSYAIIGSDPKGLNYNWFAGHGPPPIKP